MKRINYIIALIATLSIYNVNAQTPTSEKIKWISFEEAVKLNETTPKKIFIDVYTDWCGWCKKMDQTTFIDPEVVKYINDNFHAVKFDAEQSESIEFMGYTFVNENPNGPRKGTHQLAAALLQGKMSYPSYVFMNEKNQIITVLPGYVEAKNLIPILEYFGSNAYLDTKWEDYSKQTQ
ncbi:MAG: DUF255 domain-containing protein [Lentimicrobiaceae bacterium]|nr:DUF255 domain-containing protein [Lentimicrobiaceae bacterium]